MQKKDEEMAIIHKIRHLAKDFYRHHIVCEQYPMLTSASRREWQAKGALGLVYMLHHVTEKNPKGVPTNEDLKVSPRCLEKIIIRYKKRSFDFISLDQLHGVITSDGEPARPFVAFTLDDGYLDNYTEALPVFERHGVPFTIFVATDFIDRKAILWWDSVEALILRNDEITTGDGRTFPCNTLQQRWDSFRLLRQEILCSDQQNLEEELKRLFSHYDIDWREPVSRQAMTWEQVRDISRHQLCTIGAHTVSHPALNKVTDERFHFEIAEGRKKLESVVGGRIRHFAYPYGTVNEIGSRERRLISEYGFDTIFFSDGGCVTTADKHHADALPRIYLHEY